MFIDTLRFSTPNISGRHGSKIDTLVIHHTGGKFPGCAAWLCNKESRVSAHYVLNRKGEIYQLADNKFATWHAGRSGFDYNDDGTISDQEKGMNRRSIGIELESYGYEYTTEQMESLKGLCLQLLYDYNIPVKRVLGHKEIVENNRKWDPGNFDMDFFRRELSKLKNDILV